MNNRHKCWCPWLTRNSWHKKSPNRETQWKWNSRRRSDLKWHAFEQGFESCRTQMWEKKIPDVEWFENKVEFYRNEPGAHISWIGVLTKLRQALITYLSAEGATASGPLGLVAEGSESLEPTTEGEHE